MEKEKTSSAVESLPYIIQIKNLTNTTLADVQILDHNYKDIQDKIEFTCLNAGVSYADILFHLTDKKFIISKTFAQCDNPAQYPFDLDIQKGNDQEGKPIWDTMLFRVRYNQNQKEVVCVRKEFILNNKTKLRLEFLLPNNTITFRFYQF